MIPCCKARRDELHQPIPSSTAIGHGRREIFQCLKPYGRRSTTQHKTLQTNAIFWIGIVEVSLLSGGRCVGPASNFEPRPDAASIAISSARQPNSRCCRELTILGDPKSPRCSPFPGLRNNPYVGERHFRSSSLGAMEGLFAYSTSRACRFCKWFYDPCILAAPGSGVPRIR